MSEITLTIIAQNLTEEEVADGLPHVSRATTLRAQQCVNDELAHTYPIARFCTKSKKSPYFRALFRIL